MPCVPNVPSVPRVRCWALLWNAVGVRARRSPTPTGSRNRARGRRRRTPGTQHATPTEPQPGSTGCARLWNPVGVRGRIMEPKIHGSRAFPANPGCAARPWALLWNAVGVRTWGGCRGWPAYPANPLLWNAPGVKIITRRRAFPAYPGCAARPRAVLCNAFGVNSIPEGDPYQSPGSPQAHPGCRVARDPSVPRRGSTTQPRVAEGAPWDSIRPAHLCNAFGVDSFPRRGYTTEPRVAEGAPWDSIRPAPPVPRRGSTKRG